MSTKTETAEPTARPVQPKCANLVDGHPCNHAASFHGTRRGRCRALGCKCERWKEPLG